LEKKKGGLRLAYLTVLSSSKGAGGQSKKPTEKKNSEEVAMVKNPMRLGTPKIPKKNR